MRVQPVETVEDELRRLHPARPQIGNRRPHQLECVSYSLPFQVRHLVGENDMRKCSHRNRCAGGFFPRTARGPGRVLFNFRVGPVPYGLRRQLFPVDAPVVHGTVHDALPCQRWHHRRIRSVAVTNLSAPRMRRTPASRRPWMWAPHRRTRPRPIDAAGLWEDWKKRSGDRTVGPATLSPDRLSERCRPTDEVHANENENGKKS